MTLVAEQRIGIYILQRAIGKGGMGTVYLAHDPTLQRPVAIKILPAALAADPDYVARFEREATSLARIRHPNLMHIYAVGCDAGRHYIAMEYVRGHTLARVLRKQGALHHKTALRVLGQVLSALHKVHATGLIHRDLKSSNIMIDEDRRAILMDFGLAKPPHDHSVTTGHTLIGTPEYMAPELAEGGDASFRSDIYAAGVVLYEMVTGRVPFSASSAIATLRQQVEQAVPPARELAPELPAELDAVLAIALAKKPDDRYPDIPAMAADLAAVRRTGELVRLARARPAAPTMATGPAGTRHAMASASPTAATLRVDAPPAPASSSPAPTAATVVPPSRRSRWLVPAAIAAACLLAIALTAVVLPRALRRGGPPAAVDPRQATTTTPAAAAIPALAAPATRTVPDTSASAKAPTTTAPPQPAASKHRYVVLSLGGMPVAGRLVSVDPEKNEVTILADDGREKVLAYRSVLRIDKSGGR